MSWPWVVLVGMPIVTALCRDLVSLRRHALRRESIERIVRDRTGVIRVVDSTAEGEILAIEVLPASEGTPGLDPRSGRA